MKIKISYFNNIRNFTSNMIPVSTAIYDPKWYKIYHLDKNNVFNGIRLNELHLPKEMYESLEQKCKRECELANSGWCQFMNKYYDYLNTLKFENVIAGLDYLGKSMKELLKLEEEPVIVLIVHESPTVKCAERPVLIKWFKDHNYILEEV